MQLAAEAPEAIRAAVDTFLVEVLLKACTEVQGFQITELLRGELLLACEVLQELAETQLGVAATRTVRVAGGRNPHKKVK